MQTLRKKITRFTAFATFGFLLAASIPAIGQARVIEVLADKDSHFKIPGQSRAEITVKAGEPVVLRIDARKGKTWNRDGTVHGFTLLHAKDHSKVPGWNLELKPGKQEFALTAPTEPGEYEVLCTVICSEDHESMRMKFTVVPQDSKE
jgi:heme/copper-type cytochrome/quinol oxidase subunit 2